MASFFCLVKRRASEKGSFAGAHTRHVWQAKGGPQVATRLTRHVPPHDPSLLPRRRHRFREPSQQHHISLRTFPSDGNAEMAALDPTRHKIRRAMHSGEHVVRREGRSEIKVYPTPARSARRSTSCTPHFSLPSVPCPSRLSKTRTHALPHRLPFALCFLHWWHSEGRGSYLGF